MTDPTRRVFRVEGHPGAHLSNHPDGALAAIKVAQAALDDEGLTARIVEVADRPAPDVVIVVARDITSESDPCLQEACGHPYSDHRGGEDCVSCGCTWFDTIGESPS